jgi:hypothetical protein
MGKESELNLSGVEELQNKTHSKSDARETDDNQSGKENPPQKEKKKKKKKKKSKRKNEGRLLYISPLS